MQQCIIMVIHCRRGRRRFCKLGNAFKRNFVGAIVVAATRSSLYRDAPVNRKIVHNDR